MDRKTSNVIPKTNIETTYGNLRPARAQRPLTPFEEKTNQLYRHVVFSTNDGGHIHCKQYVSNKQYTLERRPERGLEPLLPPPLTGPPHSNPLRTSEPVFAAGLCSSHAFSCCAVNQLMPRRHWRLGRVRSLFFYSTRHFTLRISRRQHDRLRPLDGRNDSVGSSACAQTMHRKRADALGSLVRGQMWPNSSGGR